MAGRTLGIMRALWFRLWLILWPIAIVLFLYPINNMLTRSSFIFAMAGLWAGCLYFGWRSRTARAVFLSCTFIVTVFLICPGRNYATETLRTAYVASLRSFEGTRYIWGGENKRGIDCSGLVRAGLVKATFQQGLLTLNPGLVRYSLSLWWHDSSAEALGEEYRHQTKRFMTMASINGLDQSKILPGDIAVTVSGVHVLAYLGNREWIEADPHFGRVVVVKTPATKNPWFEESVHILRWKQLEEKQP
jgi:hypothetical protein